MQASKQLYSLYFLFLIVLGCKNEHKSSSGPLSDSLVQKEERLQVREQEILKREGELAIREQRVDSLISHIDTLGIYKPSITGEWRVSMICNETTCEGYAVGDTKTELWKISYQNNKVIVTAFANRQLIRTYHGLLKTDGLQLSAVPAPDSQTQISAVLNLNPQSETLMEGARTISKTGNCKVEFTVKAEKQ